MRTRGLLGGAAGPCGVRKPAIAMIRPAVAVLSGVRRSQRGRKSALRVGGTEGGSGRAMAAAGDLDRRLLQQLEEGRSTQAATLKAPANLIGHQAAARAGLALAARTKRQHKGRRICWQPRLQRR